MSSPIRGVITGWRVVGTGTFQLFTGRYTGDDEFKRGKLSDKSPGSSLTAPSALIKTRLRVEADDLIGLAYLAGSSVAFKRDIVGGDLDMWSPVPALGVSTLANDKYRDLGNRAGFQAIVEYDHDGDGYGDESQDRCPTQALTTGPCGARTVPPLPEVGDGQALPDEGLPIFSPPLDLGPEVPEPDGGPPQLFFVRSPHIARVVSASRGATLTFTVNATATATTEFQRKRGKGRSADYRFVGSKVTRAVGASISRVPIRRSVAGTRLHPGEYRVRVRAIGDAGQYKTSGWVKFTVKR
jgi:hypothetical protein